MVFLTVLSARDYCVIIDPWNVEEKKPMLGTKKVVAGPITFFLQPFESLENGVEVQRKKFWLLTGTANIHVNCW